MRLTQRGLLVLFFAVLVLLLVAPPVNANSEMKVTVYASLSCPPCKEYVEATVPALRDSGITDITVKDWSEDVAIILELQTLHEEFGVPKSLRGKATTVVDSRFLFEGFVPAEDITRFLEDEAGNYKRFVLYLSPGEETYKIMNDLGQVIECPVSEPLRGCDAERFKLIPPDEAMLPLVVGAGILNGFNPCFISVLLILAAVLYSLGKSRGQVLKAGVVYLLVIFLVYLSAGLGVLHAIGSLPAFFLLTKIGAVIIIVLGVLNIKDYFWYGKGFSLRLPKSQVPRASAWIRRASLPAAGGLGVLVGFLTFPCMGGIYVAIIGMLALRLLYFEALGYLFLFSFATILPSIVLLYFASNRTVTEKMYGWKESRKKWMKLAGGLAMVAIGLFILTI